MKKKNEEEIIKLFREITETGSESELITSLLDLAYSYKKGVTEVVSDYKFIRNKLKFKKHGGKNE